jgi:uncharacterized protein YoxC
MGPGGIATIIAAGALMVIALAIAYFIVRASRLMDEINKTIQSVNRIASTAENLTEKLGSLVTNLTSVNSGIFSLLSSVTSLIPGFARKKNANNEHSASHSSVMKEHE